MSEYRPPDFSNLPTFNPQFYRYGQIGALSEEYLDTRYLKFPASQYHQQTFNAGAFLANSSALTFTDGTSLNTAPVIPVDEVIGSGGCYTYNFNSHNITSSLGSNALGCFGFKIWSGVSSGSPDLWDGNDVITLQVDIIANQTYTDKTTGAENGTFASNTTYSGIWYLKPYNLCMNTTSTTIVAPQGNSGSPMTEGVGYTDLATLLGCNLSPNANYWSAVNSIKSGSYGPNNQNNGLWTLQGGTDAENNCTLNMMYLTGNQTSIDYNRNKMVSCNVRVLGVPQKATGYGLGIEIQGFTGFNGQDVLEDYVSYASK